MLSEYEAKVLRAHRDSDPDAIRAGVALALACELLCKSGLMEWSGNLTDAGHAALAEFDDALQEQDDG